MADDFGMGYALGADSGNRNNNDMFGCGGSWWIVIILFALIFGNNWGNNGNNGAGMAVPYLSGIDTRQAVNDGFVTAEIQSGIRGLQNGLCDGFYAMNTGMLNGQIAMQQGFNATQMGMMQGFNGVQGQICDLGARQQQCCCETQRLMERGFADTNYNLATQSCDIRNTIQSTARDVIDNANANTRSILDFMVNDKISTLQQENQTLRLAASQSEQNAVLKAAMDANTAELIRRTGNSTPQPTYLVQNPHAAYCGAGCQQGYGCC